MALFASFISDFWNDQLVEHGRQYLFLVFAGLLLSFAFIRLSTRLMRSPAVPWWPGSVVSDSGVHVHHLVFGIFTMMIAGITSFTLHNVGFWYDVSALAFGVGIGLTIDELLLSARALLVGRSLGIGDSDINLRTVVLAARELRGYGPSLRSRSSNSR